MEIVLDTNKKTITVRWNYTQKLEEIKRMIKEFFGADAHPRLSAVTFTNAGRKPWRILIRS